MPQFDSSKQTHIVAHREYIKDITTSSVAGAFKNESFIINPGQAATFPWLSSIAENYEQYRVHGMIFQFVTTSADALNSTNTALGTVIMATDYNAASPAYTNKQQMENSQYANSAKPSVSQMHGIECAPALTPVSQLFTRSGALPSGQDSRWYDLAKFQLATTGFQAAGVVVGELWCTYLIEFMKPQIPATIGGNFGSAHRYATSAASATPFGTVELINVGSFNVSASGTSLTIKDVLPGAKLSIAVTWYQASGSITSLFGTSSLTGANNLTYYAGDTLNSIVTGFGALSNAQNQTFNVVSTSSVVADIVLTLSGYTISAGCDVFISELDSTITA